MRLACWRKRHAFADFLERFICPEWPPYGKSVSARRRNQHARRVRYPDNLRVAQQTRRIREISNQKSAISNSIMNNGSEPLIRLSSVTKVFLTDEVETHALSGIHLDIRPGEYVSIAGASRKTLAKSALRRPTTTRGRRPGARRQAGHSAGRRTNGQS